MKKKKETTVASSILAMPAQPKKTQKAFLAVPCAENVRNEFAQCLAGLTHHNAQKLIHSPSCFIVSSVLHDSRNKLVLTFINNEHVRDAEWMIFIDSDMAFPNDAVERLISHPPHVKIVGANYCSRIEPYRPTAMKFGGHVFTEDNSSGLEEVEGMGMGLVAIHRDVIDTLEMPYFDWITGKTTFLGEDVYFFNKVRQNGFKVYVDHDLSKEVFHIGSMKLSNDLASRFKPPQGAIAR
jgi:hypothetical protein